MWRPIETLPTELKLSMRLLRLRHGNLQCVGFWSKLGWNACDKETFEDFQPTEWSLY